MVGGADGKSNTMSDYMQVFITYGGLKKFGCINSTFKHVLRHQTINTVVPFKSHPNTALRTLLNR